MKSKTSKIISQKAPRKKEPLGAGAKFGIFVCILILAGLGFGLAEYRGFTGTQFFGKTVFTESAQSAKPGNKNTALSNAASAETETPPPRPALREPPAESAEANAYDDRDDRPKKATKKKSSSAKKTSPPTPPLPPAAFPEIARAPHTWPGFIRLTRGRSIAIVDPQTGISMGHMDIPAGTVVKVEKVLPTGTLEVLDRTGQKFKVEASGTNFSAAFYAVKNKPKKNKSPKKTVATTKKPAAPAGNKPAPSTTVSASEKKKSSESSPAMSAFGVVADDDDWEDDAED